jgi:hypothetical protein
VDVAISAAILPVNATSDGSPGTGRETQSMEFFSSAEIPELYSGEAMSSPWCATNRSLSFLALAGCPSAASRSPS